MVWRGAVGRGVVWRRGLAWRGVTGRGVTGRARRRMRRGRVSTAARHGTDAARVTAGEHTGAPRHAPLRFRPQPPTRRNNHPPVWVACGSPNRPIRHVSRPAAEDRAADGRRGSIFLPLLEISRPATDGHAGQVPRGSTFLPQLEVSRPAASAGAPNGPCGSTFGTGRAVSRPARTDHPGSPDGARRHGGAAHGGTVPAAHGDTLSHCYDN